MFRLVSKALILLAGFAVLAAAQDQAPPKELVQYIRDAQKAGQNVFQIQQNAVNSGWPTTTVSQAIAYVHDQDAAANPVASGKPATDSKDAAAAVKPEAAPAGESPAPAGGTPAAAAPAAGEKPAEGTKPPVATVGTKPEKVNRGVPDDYQFGAGDSLEINVWKEPDASVRGAAVRTDGKISMPLLKEVEVVGLTPVQLEKLITDRLTDGGFLVAPDVTVIVTGTGSKKIYVQGKVRKEGPIPFVYNMTVMQALSEAGGLNEYAKKNKIYIMRTQNGKTFRFPFDYTAILKGQHLELNIQVQAGDWIIVP